MSAIGYASPASQYDGVGEVPEDTEQMFWLRMEDDYASRVKLADLLTRQYRYREAVEQYRRAEDIRQDDAALYLRLGGALLTLFRFDEARAAYRKCEDLGMREQSTAFYFGVWNYLTGAYGTAAEYFEKVLPCGDEMAIAAIYWHTLSAVRAGIPCALLGEVRPDMNVGHHTAYRKSMGVFLGEETADVLREETIEDKNDLNAAIQSYALAVYYENAGDSTRADECRKLCLSKESVWPCVASLAARRDE